MRKRKRMMWVALCAVGAALCLNSCFIATTAVELSRDAKKYPVEVALHDGGTITGEAKLPNGRTKKVTVKDENGNKTNLKSADIARLTVWNAKAPDSRFVLVFQNKTWRTLKAVGQHIAIFSQSADYYINKNGVMTVKGNAISYYGLRPGDEEATFIVQQSESTLARAARKALIAYFADDPDLCKAIENKEINPYDFDRICEEYVPEGKR